MGEKTCGLCGKVDDIEKMVKDPEYGWLCDDCDCGDEGLVKCGICGKEMRRKDAHLSVKHLYLCDDCPDEFEGDDLSDILPPTFLEFACAYWNQQPNNLLPYLASTITDLSKKHSIKCAVYVFSERYNTHAIVFASKPVTKDEALAYVNRELDEQYRREEEDE